MVGWPHQHNGHEFEQTLGDSEGQGSLSCCSSWDCKESDTTWRLNKLLICESKKRLVNRIKKKETHRYREQASGYQWGEGEAIKG